MTDLDRILSGLKAAHERQTYHKFDFFEPYAKQQDFFSAGAQKRERLLMAGNQLGKTYAGAFEMTCHLTGDYPDWWQGRRFTKAVKAWACGESSLLVRDVQQKLLCGEPGVEAALGTGMIPKEKFVDKPSLARGVTDAFDTVQVRHVSGGISVLRFKSYEQGRTKLQGETIDVGWCDEEPDLDIYSEILTRTTATGGMVYTTFTPLKGMSAVVLRFLNEDNDSRSVVVMTIDDALHIPPAKRAEIIAGYPEHEREARVRGTPMLGSGLIYQFSMAQIGEQGIEYVPLHWSKLWTIDFGIDHPFAAVLMAWDKDADCLHVLHTIKMKGGTPLQHAVPLKTYAANAPVGWPHDGNNRDKGSGETLAALYKKQGLLMTPSHMTWPDGGLSPEAGVLELQNRMETGRFKVANHLADWWEEQRLYHRKDGVIVKTMDDLMDATRLGVMGRRYGRPVPLGGDLKKKRPQLIADGVDFDPF